MAARAQGLDQTRQPPHRPPGLPAAQEHAQPLSPTLQGQVPGSGQHAPIPGCFRQSPEGSGCLWIAACFHELVGLLQ
jgi:hypothetical protein